MVSVFVDVPTAPMSHMQYQKLCDPTTVMTERQTTRSGLGEQFQVPYDPACPCKKDRSEY